MAATATHVCDDPNPFERQKIIENCFGIIYDKGGTLENEFLEYWNYYRKQAELLHFGKGDQWRSQWTFPIRYHAQVIEVIAILKRGQSRADRSGIESEIRALLAPQHVSDHDIGEVIYLGLRLWLMINFRSPRQKSVVEGGRPCLEWQNGCTLTVQVSNLFRRSTTELSPSQSRLNPNFKMANMANVCGLQVKWTTSLEDHLGLDREHKTIWVFSHRRFLKFSDPASQLPGHVPTHLKKEALTVCRKNVSASVSRQSPIAAEIFDETSRTLDLLFPSWDPSTKRMLKQMRLDFHSVNPQNRLLDLKHYSYWRDRLLELYEDVYLAPPEGWAQLWRDRRDPQRFWTFWVALLVLLLTILSTFATLLQTWLSLKAARGG